MQLRGHLATSQPVSNEAFATRNYHGPQISAQKYRVGNPKILVAQATNAAKASRVPTPDEDKEVLHEAFMRAYQQALPGPLRIEGLQEFAGAIWERRRRIPSTVYQDPLQHVFDEFDTNGDGSLSASEVAAALNSRNVKITEEQVQVFIDAVDSNHNGMVDRDEFADFIFHLAAAEQKRSKASPAA